MSRENIIGLASEQKIERLCECFEERVAGFLIGVRKYPPAMLEITRRILLRTAGRLHDAIKADECCCCDLTHDDLRASVVVHKGRLAHDRTDIALEIILNT